MSDLKVGDKAPQFTGVNQNGDEISLTDFSGKKLILYFYPKDNTPGCNAEACNLNDNYTMWLDKGFDVVGVSPDDEKKHLKFIDKFGLKFNLIADTEKEILQSYNAWGEKKLYGRVYMGVLRKTFVIDEKSTIIEIFEKVKTKDHTNQIITALNI